MADTDEEEQLKEILNNNSVESVEIDDTSGIMWLHMDNGISVIILGTEYNLEIEYRQSSAEKDE